MAKAKTASEPRPDWHTQLTVGECYVFTDATSMMYVGRLARVEGPHTVTLTEAAWVSETGRLHAFLRDGRADGMEIEPVGVRGDLHHVGWYPWPHPLLVEAV